MAAAPEWRDGGRRRLTTINIRWLAGGPADRCATPVQAARAERADGALPLRTGARIRGQAVYLMRILRDRRRSRRRAAAGEHAGCRRSVAADTGFGTACDICRGEATCTADASRDQRHVIPEKLLWPARSMSYSTFGGARPGEPRPFASLLSAEDSRRARFLARRPGALARGAARRGWTRQLPGLPPVRSDRGFPFHRPRRQGVRLAAEPHRGRHLARIFHAETAAPARPTSTRLPPAGEPNRFRPLSLRPAADWSAAIEWPTRRRISRCPA